MKRILPLLSILLLAACAVTAQQDGVMKAEERSSGFMGLSKNADIEVTEAKAFEGKTKVVIGGFKVGFNESKKLQNKAGGGLLGGGFGGKSTGLVKLEGVDVGLKQDITDAAYAHFLTALEDAGYEVQNRSAFVSSEHFEGTKLYDFPYVNDDSGFMSEYGVATYYSPTSIGDKQPVFMGDIQGVTGGFGFANPGNAAGSYGMETGIPVISVTYFVDFAGAAGHGGKWKSTSSLKVGQLLAVDQGTLAFIGGPGGTFSTAIGSIKLGQPIASDKEFATVTESSSQVNKGVETVVNVASALMGGGTNQTREFTYEADAGKYKAASLDVLEKTNTAFAEKMAEMR